MSDERAAFMRAICENPEDDTVRLVFADWLEEHGEGERAEFIRRACGGLPIPLNKHNALTWFDVFPGIQFEVRNHKSGHYLWYYGEPHNTVVIRRGFVRSITCTAADWLAHADTIFWSPKQMSGELCQRCKNYPGMYSDGCQCPGKTPRPFPPTAQPITEVTLTTHPATAGWAHGRVWFRDDPAQEKFDGPRMTEDDDMTVHDVAAIILPRRYPGITFRLPTV